MAEESSTPPVRRPPQALGALVLPVIRPLPARTLVAGLSVTILLTAVFSFLVEVPRREYVAGWVEPQGGEVRILAPFAATVVSIAETGAELSKGQPVVALRDSRSGPGGDVAVTQSASVGANLAAVQAELLTLEREQSEREAAIQRQLSLARQTVEQARAETKSRREAASLQSAEIGRIRPLVEAGLANPGKLELLQSQQRLQDAEAQASGRAELSALAQVESLQGELTQSRTKLSVMLSEKGRLASDMKAQLSAADSAVKSEIPAGRDSRVLASAVTVGSSVSQGQLLAVLSAKSAQMQAMLQVPARAAARIVPGQEVQLRLAAFPYETYGPVTAVIEHVEQVPLRPDESSLLRHAPGVDAVVRATARIVVIPQERVGLPRPIALRSGMQFEASVEIERRTLLAWVMWPLLKQFN